MLQVISHFGPSVILHFRGEQVLREHFFLSVTNFIILLAIVFSLLVGFLGFAISSPSSNLYLGGSSSLGQNILRLDILQWARSSWFT